MPSSSESTQTAPIDTPRFDLSLRQMIASTGAAVTAAVLGSRLGVAGTLIGAALASIVSMAAAAIYSHSLAKAQYRVRQARSASQGPTVDAADAPTTIISLPNQAWGQVGAAPPSSPSSSAATHRVQPPRRPRQNWLWVGVGALAACIIALGAITGFEALRGAPISGGGQGGLSVLGGGPAGIVDTSPTKNRAPSTSSISDTTRPDLAAGTSNDQPAPAPPATGTGSATTVTTTVTQTVHPPVSSSAGSPSVTSPTVPLTGAPLTGSSFPSAASNATTTAQPRGQ